MMYCIWAAISACICLLSGVSTRPTDRLTTETTVNENATFLDNATSVTNYNGSVDVAAQDDSNLTTTDKIRLPTTTGTFSNVTHSVDLDSTTARIYPGSSQGSVDISQSDVTEATDTEPPETTTSDVSQQVHAMVNRTISLEVPMGNTGSHSTNSADEDTDNGRHRRSDYKVVLRINLTVNETDIGGYVNLEGPVQHSWVEDHEPNTDTTSAGTAAVTTGSPSPSPTPVTIAAESMAEVRMCLTDARHKASDALESYGNHPDILQMRAPPGHELIPALNFSASISPYFPLLPRTESITEATNQQQRLMVVNRESRSLHSLSRDLLHLERSHVTRNGDECGAGRTSDATINYFCHETLGSMNSLIDALSDFHLKLEKMASSESEEDTVNFSLPRGSGNANLVRYHVLSGLYQIQQRATELEVILETIRNNTEDEDK